MGEAVTPAIRNLFGIDNSAAKIEKGRVVEFKDLVLRAVFPRKRSLPDVQLVVGFLNNRINISDEHEFKKLSIMVQYLPGTTELVMTLEKDNCYIVK